VFWGVSASFRGEMRMGESAFYAGAIHPHGSWRSLTKPAARTETSARVQLDALIRAYAVAGCADSSPQSRIWVATAYGVPLTCALVTAGSDLQQVGTCQLVDGQSRAPMSMGGMLVGTTHEASVMQVSRSYEGLPLTADDDQFVAIAAYANGSGPVRNRATHTFDGVLRTDAGRPSQPLDGDKGACRKRASSARPRGGRPAGLDVTTECEVLRAETTSSASKANGWTNARTRYATPLLAADDPITCERDRQRLWYAARAHHPKRSQISCGWT
jgi:hypothetical protein